MFTIDDCETLPDWVISIEERPRPRVPGACVKV